MIDVLLGGVDLSENGQALDALREVGPGAHFLGAAHTQANFERAFYRSVVADNNSYEQWEQDGSLDAAQRANTIWKRMLEEYEAPPLDPAVDEALLEFAFRWLRFALFAEPTMKVRDHGLHDQLRLELTVIQQIARKCGRLLPDANSSASKSLP